MATGILTGCADASIEDPPPGKTQASSPVVGGTTADPGSWPWIVSLRTSNNSHYCGGSLIDPSWVLTAAHCGMPASVRVGPTASTAVVRNVTRRIVHPGYNASTSRNDVALIQLSQPVDGVETVRLNRDPGFPASVPLAEATSTAWANTHVAGWGATAEGGSGSATLLEAAVPALTNSSCANAYPNDEISASNLCAGYQGGGVDTCQGDSGGPLTFSFGRPLLAGITSWGIGCARPGLPGVYVRVSSYIDWITQNVANAEPFSPTAVITITTSG